jgi:hypothetical protein
MSSSRQKKEVIYRGGVVRFFIPDHWVEEYEADGGGTFYEPGDGTGTLRLNVLSFLTQTDVSEVYPLSIIQARQQRYNGQVERLPDGRYLLKYVTNVIEEGEELTIFRWEVARMVSPRDCNIAAFSFTITASQIQEKSMLDEIVSIEEEIKKVKFWVHADLYEGHN